MNTDIITIVLAAAVFTSCAGNSPESATEAKAVAETAIELKDYGNEPSVLDIDTYTLGNENFRTALWTGNTLQVTLMSIPVGDDVGLEIHPHIDQFLRIEEGEGRTMMGDAKDKLDFVHDLKADHAIFVPAGKWHNIVNTGNRPLKLYSIYAPVEHPHGTIHKTHTEAIEAEEME